MTQVVTQQWIPTDQTFGARLALVRQRMGWGNVKEAAVACGIAVETWRYWESKTDTSLPRQAIERAQAIADKTGVDFYWLLTGQAGGGSIEQGLRSSTRGCAWSTRPWTGRTRRSDRVTLRHLSVA